MRRLLILDNYDSFTYNLLHITEQIEGVEVAVYRNDAITLDEVGGYDAVILSPGPGLPSDAGIMMDLIKRYHQTMPILGICLGMQAIGQYFGAELVNMDEVCHGIQDEMIILKDVSFLEGLANPVLIGKYHSWAFKTNTLPFELDELATDGKYVMALEHKKYKLSGMQYHPESVMTPCGPSMLKSWAQKVWNL